MPDDGDANKSMQHYKMGRADAAHFEADARCKQK